MSALDTYGRGWGTYLITKHGWTITFEQIMAVEEALESAGWKYTYVCHYRGPATGTLHKYAMPIEDLNLSMPAYQALRRSGLITIGQVLERSEEELLSLRDFGRESYRELREKLDELGVLSFADDRVSE